jgi:hypothetical protein
VASGIDPAGKRAHERIKSARWRAVQQHGGMGLPAACLFDLDGLLLDTEPLHSQAWL